MKERSPAPLIGTVLAAMILITSAFIFYHAMFGDMGLAWSLTEQGLQIQHRGSRPLLPPEEKLISYSSVTELRVLPQPVKIKKEYGLDGVRARIGDFRSDELGQVKAFISDIGQPIVLIRATGEPKPILLSPEDAEQFIAQMHVQMGK